MSKRFLKWLRVAETDNQDKKTFSFQLFWDKAEEFELIEVAARLIENREFTRVMRIALRVIPALLDGDLEPLFEAFPWVRAEFMQYMKEVQSEPQQALPANIEDALRDILKDFSVGNSSESANAHSRVAVHRPASSTLTVKKDNKSSANVADNFLKSLGVLSGPSG